VYLCARDTKDKYILGTMFILFSCCIWHCFVSVIYKNTLVSGVTSHNSSVTTAAPKAFTTGTYTLYSTKALNVTAATAATTTLSPASAPTVLSDYIALGVFLTVYMMFNLVFLMLIVCEVNTLLSITSMML